MYTCTLALIDIAYKIYQEQARDRLYIYLVVSRWASRSMLIREEAEAQHPVYYTSKAFLDVKTWYQLVEKYALALMALARKLRPYFQAYPIEVMTNLSLR